MLVWMGGLFIFFILILVGGIPTPPEKYVRQLG